MKKLIITALVLLGSTSMSATMEDLKDALVASGNYINVGDPTQVSTRSTSPIDKTGQRFSIVVITSSATDSLVAVTKSLYIWVEDKDLPTESAYFIARNPLTVAPTSFSANVVNYMTTNGILGSIGNRGVSGNIEWAIIERYVEGSTADHVVLQSVLVTCTDGSVWAIRVIE